MKRCKTDEYKQFVLKRLIEVNYDQYKKTKILDCSLSKETKKALLNNLKGLLNFEFNKTFDEKNIKKTLDAILPETTNFIYDMVNDDEEEISNEVCSIISRFICFRGTKKERNYDVDMFWFSVLFNCQIALIKKGDFRLIRNLRSKVNLFYYSMDENADFLLTFLSLMGLYFYYQINKRNNDDISNKTRYEFECEENINDCVCYSLKNIFSMSIKKFNIKFDYFLAAFKSCNNWETIVFNKAYTPIYTNEFAISWFINCVCCSENYEVDAKFKEIFNDDFEALSSLNKFISEDTFNTESEPIKMAEFYFGIPKAKRIFSDNKNEKQFIEIFKKISEENLLKSIPENPEEVLRKKEKEITSKCNSILEKNDFIGSGTGTMPDTYELTVGLEIQSITEPLNIEEIAVDYFLDFLKEKIRNIGIVKLDIGETTNIQNIVEVFKEKRVSDYSDNLDWILKYARDNEKSKFIIDKIANGRKIRKCNLIGDQSVVFNNGVEFNSIVEVKARYLTNKELDEEVEECRRSDSLYVLDGYFGEREDIKNKLHDRKIKLDFKFKYKLIYEPNSLVEITEDYIN